MNREELITEVAKKTKLSKKATGEVLSATIMQFKHQLKKETKLL